MTNTLTFRLLERIGMDSESDSARPVISVDFEIDGTSLFKSLSRTDGRLSDLMGCIEKGNTRLNELARAALITGAASEGTDGRVLLYICPECGDIACGAYAARITVADEAIEWSDFAFVNGYEADQPIQDLGPYYFTPSEYERVITSACAL